MRSGAGRGKSLPGESRYYLKENKAKWDRGENRLRKQIFLFAGAFFLAVLKGFYPLGFAL